MPWRSSARQASRTARKNRVFDKLRSLCVINHNHDARDWAGSKFRQQSLDLFASDSDEANVAFVP
jgi:hypothetical protein